MKPLNFDSNEFSVIILNLRTALQGFFGFWMFFSRIFTKNIGGAGGHPIHYFKFLSNIIVIFLGYCLQGCLEMSNDILFFTVRRRNCFKGLLFNGKFMTTLPY